MNANTWSAADVLAALERRGYQRLPTPDHPRSRDVWYSSPASALEAKQYVALTPNYGKLAFGFRFGFSVPAARVILEAALPRFNELVVDYSVPSGLYCWTTFDAGRLLEWPVLAIPCPTNPARGSEQFKELVDRVLVPTFESAVSPKAVLERLLRSDVPFD